VRACKGAAPDAQAADAAVPGAWGAWAPQTQSAKTAAGACAPGVFGAPVSAIRSFLSKTPARAAIPTPWLGIRGETESAGTTHGVRVVAVAPQSPAERGGLKPGTDVIVAVDGRPIDSPESLAEAIGKHATGDVVKLLVFGQDKGQFREVAVGLRAAP
jgi:serine protease Do